MAVQKISIDQFLYLAKEHPVLDVRSPSEFLHAHIPLAHNLPLFSDEERKIVGTTYKQQSRQQAIKIGLDYFGVKMRKMVEEVESLMVDRGSLPANIPQTPNEQCPVRKMVEEVESLMVDRGSLTANIPQTPNEQCPVRKTVEEMESLTVDRGSLPAKMPQTPNEQPPTNNILVNDQRSANIVLIYCWRGGMRSAAVAWLLDVYGYKVYTLTGGYKAFRNRVFQQFSQPFRLNILGGYTGSGKTMLIKELHRLGQPVINLEALANHKGSAFGSLGERPQPSQEMFENLLATELFYKAPYNKEHPGETIWVEDESQRIGLLNIPPEFWKKMRISPVYFIDIPFAERLNHLINSYGTFSKDELCNAINRIRKRLGGMETKNAVSCLTENNIAGCFEILLKYYDKWYTRGLNNRTDLDKMLYKIFCPTVTPTNTKLLLSIESKEFAS